MCRSGTDSATSWRAGIGTAFRLARAELGLLRRRRRALRRRDRRLSGTGRHPCGERARPAALRSCSTRSSRSPTRSWTTAAGSRQARCRPGRLRLIDRARPSRGGRRRGGHRRERALPRATRRARATSRRASSAQRTRCFSPTWRPAAFTHALFVGKLIPLHGIETILGAARLAPELAFRIVGSGQLESLLEAGRPTSNGSPGSSTSKLRNEHAAAGVALGIFGTSSKAARVIPNKAFQALACGAPPRHRRHAGRARAPDGWPGCAPRPAGRSGRPRASAPATRDRRRAPHRIGFEGHRRRTTMRASEAALGWRWREIIERAAA